jgi:hypothetical protein
VVAFMKKFEIPAVYVGMLLGDLKNYMMQGI